MSQVTTQKIGPFEYDEAVELIQLYALALTNLGLQKRFSVIPVPQPIVEFEARRDGKKGRRQGAGFQIALLDRRPEEPKPQELSVLGIRQAASAGYKKTNFEAFGQTKTLAEWAKVAGVTRTTLKTRVDAGMTVEEAITDIALNSRRRCA